MAAAPQGGGGPQRRLVRRGHAGAAAASVRSIRRSACRSASGPNGLVRHSGGSQAAFVIGTGHPRAAASDHLQGCDRPDLVAEDMWRCDSAEPRPRGASSATLSPGVWSHLLKPGNGKRPSPTWRPRVGSARGERRTSRMALALTSPAVAAVSQVWHGSHGGCLSRGPLTRDHCRSICPPGLAGGMEALVGLVFPAERHAVI